jgi:hypothetical protein
MRGSCAPFENRSMGTILRGARLAGLAAIAPASAMLGGLIDERHHLGFTNWRSACRATGISLPSLFHFTLELLPNAVIGALSGALLVQVLAFSLRRQPGSADTCLAAHLGCAVAMPIGLLLCALALPLPLMLVAEVALAVIAATGILALWGRKFAARVPLHP